MCPNPIIIVLLKRFRILLIYSFSALLTVSIARLCRANLGEDEGVALSNSRPENAPLVAITFCIKSGMYEPGYFIEHSLLPSIYGTITKEERAAYRVELILGYDHDDEYWQQEHTHQLSPKSNWETIYDDHEPIPINFVSIRKDSTGDRPNRIPFNELCQAAFEYGATYIVRINDDSEFKSRGWITVATEALQSFSPPNIGVVGPTCHQGNTDIMTHDFVHAPTHYSIFDTYYPRAFDNYYVDDWITHVYGEERTTKLKDWEVIHHLTTFGTRYKPTFHQDKLLDQLVKEGRESVEKATLEKKKSELTGFKRKIERQRDDLRVLGTETIERVDGPMEDVHLSLAKSDQLSRAL